MNMKEKMSVLRQDVVLPEIVQNKAEAAFEEICLGARQSGNMSPETGNKTGYRKHPRKLLFVSLAAVLAVGAATAGAAVYREWSRSLEEELRVTEEQKQVAEASGLTDFPEISVTSGDVTVTAQQSIVDNYFGFLSFKVEGFALEEGEEPGFDSIDITVGGETYNWGASFYDGTRVGDDGRAVLADGSPIPRDENGALRLNYVMEDGSLEYRVSMSSGGKAGSFFNKPIHVELCNLGVYEGKAGPVDVRAEGRWVFDWTLAGDGSTRIVELDQALGDTGAVIKKAEISPISLRVICEFPHQIQKEIAINAETGEEEEVAVSADPPHLMGVKLKDGTLLPYLYEGPGSYGYLEADDYEMRFAINRLLDIDQVEALLFQKQHPEGENPITENDLYVVDIG